MAFIGVKMQKEEKEKLIQLASKKGMSLSELIRELIEKENDNEWMKDDLNKIKKGLNALLKTNKEALNKFREDNPELFERDHKER